MSDLARLEKLLGHGKPVAAIHALVLLCRRQQAELHEQDVELARLHTRLAAADEGLDTLLALCARVALVNPALVKEGIEQVMGEVIMRRLQACGYWEEILELERREAERPPEFILGAFNEKGQSQ